MRIYTDHNGVAVNAIISTGDGTNVEGHEYQVLAGAKTTNISFQRGGVDDSGVTGMTSEALLAILIHRTKVLDGRVSCGENMRAICHIEDALANLEARTARRMVRGVEGKSLA